MLGKLRVKFVVIVMASVAVVLAVVFTGICVSEYQRNMAEVDSALNNAINRSGDGMRGGDRRMEQSSDSSWPSGALDSSAPRGGFSSSSAEPPDGVQPPEKDGLPKGEAPSGLSGSSVPAEEGGGRFSAQRIGGGDGGGERSLVPVAVYQLAETYDESAQETSTELTLVSGFATAALDDDVLESASAQVLGAEDGQGTLDSLGLYYLKREAGGATYVAFADMGSASSWRSLAISLAVAGLVVLAVFFVIALLLSKWALKPVEEAWTAQRQFVADASHELKTPLTVVLANTSILLKHPEQSIASQSQWIESTQVEAENMQGLVNEMLELAQVESRANVQHEPVDFSDMVDAEVLQFESVAFERGCSFKDDVAPGISLNGDVQRLRKMVSTLIENALKYVNDGGEVSVQLTAEGKQAVLKISNTGSTIAPEDLPHIFDRFYRTDKARTSGAGGYGLGLAIAREIAREHGGDITCLSSVESGTCFVVRLDV